MEVTTKVIWKKRGYRVRGLLIVVGDGMEERTPVEIMG